MSTFNSRTAAMVARQRDRFGTASLTFTNVTPGALTTGTGKRAESTSTVTVKAIRRPIDPGFAGVGDVGIDAAEFVVVVSDLGGTAPNANDRFTDSDGAVYTITRMTWESDRTVVVLHARKAR